MRTAQAYVAGLVRVVTRLFGDDLRMLERFQHASRKAPPQVRDATVAWYDPESGLDLFPYASCGTAALEWGLTPEIVRDCVEGRTPTANGLYFRRQTSWLLPAGAEMVACGVYRVGDRYRVQLGHDWGFLGNFDSSATAQLVHHDARAKLRRAGLALTAQTATQLSRGKSCSSDLARHTAESGAVSTRRGVSVTCPLCRRRAKLEISN